MPKINKKKLELRTSGEIRQTEDAGIVDAYLTAWDTVDSYNTTFQRGSFGKTFREREGKIKLIWNHEELAGKVLEAREDDYGPFVRVQFNLDTEVGKKAFSHVKAGDVDAFSFGFNVVDDKWIDGTRNFIEVRVLECGPVIFPANENAMITDARAEDFNETVTESELRNRGWRLIYALESTLDEIQWNNNNINNLIAMVDAAITDFHGAYLEWISDSYNFFGDASMIRALQDDLKHAVRKHTTDDIVLDTGLTKKDLENLRHGLLLDTENRNKLECLHGDVKKAHDKKRNEKVEELCKEIRSAGFNPAEKARFSALLGISPNQSQDDAGEMLNFIKNLRKTIKE